MKLLKNNKTKTLEVLSLLTDMIIKSEEIYTLTQPEQYKDGKGWWFVDYYNMLDIIYLLMTDEDHNSVYGSFKSSSYDKDDLPVAWYKSKGEPKVGKGWTITPKLVLDCVGDGYMPDRIDEVIYSYKLDAELKYKLLTIMFTHLVALKKKYKKKRKK